MEPRVVHDSANHRFEIYLDSQRVGLMDYSIRSGEIHLVHTEVDPAHQGKNLAAILLRESLATIRSQELGKVVPVCSYTVKYMEKHPETQDLLLNPIEDALAQCRWPGMKS
jgi:predicted GNAT family acetyltransferase